MSRVTKKTGPSPIASARDHIERRVHTTQKQLASLVTEVERLREENRELRRTLARLQRAAVALDITRIERDELSSQSQALLREQARLARELAALEDRNDELHDEAATAAEELVREQESHEFTKVELACMRRQVEELVKILALVGGDGGSTT